jgi:hypothetical protein
VFLDVFYQVKFFVMFFGNSCSEELNDTSDGGLKIYKYLYLPRIEDIHTPQLRMEWEYLNGTRTGATRVLSGTVLRGVWNLQGTITRRMRIHNCSPCSSYVCMHEWIAMENAVRPGFALKFSDGAHYTYSPYCTGNCGTRVSLLALWGTYINLITS